MYAGMFTPPPPSALPFPRFVFTRTAPPGTGLSFAAPCWAQYHTSSTPRWRPQTAHYGTSAYHGTCAHYGTPVIPYSPVPALGAAPLVRLAVARPALYVDAASHYDVLADIVSAGCAFSAHVRLYASANWPLVADAQQQFAHVQWVIVPSPTPANSQLLVNAAMLLDMQCCPRVAVIAPNPVFWAVAHECMRRSSCNMYWQPRFHEEDARRWFRYTSTGAP